MSAWDWCVGIVVVVHLVRWGVGFLALFAALGLKAFESARNL